MDKLEENLTRSAEKNANINVNVSGLRDESTARNSTSIGIQYSSSSKRGVYIDVVDGQSLLNVSVPVKERNLALKVSGVFDNQTKRLELLDYTFNHSDDVFPKHVVKLKVNGTKKIGEIMQKHIEELSVCVDNVEKKYEATSIEVSSGCLELRFQHKSEQSARAMVADQKQIEGMFEEFAKRCGQEADVSVQAEYELVERGELEAPTQRKDRTHSQSRTTGSDTGALSERIITLGPEYEAHPLEFKTDLQYGVQSVGSLLDPELLARRTRIGSETTDSGTCDLEDEMLLTGSSNREPEDPTQRKDRTHSQSRTTGSDTGALSGRIITLDLKDIIDPGESFKRGMMFRRSHSISKETRKLYVEKITQYLSALRNSGGGKLRLQMPQPSVFEWDLFQESTLANCLERCLLHDELQAVVFEITVNEKKRKIVVDAKPSSKLITFKFNTKIKNVASFLDPTKGQMTALLQTRRKETPAKLKGIDWDIRPGNSVYFKSGGGIKQPTDLSCIRKFLVEDKKLHECISAMSKNIYGGSYFLGIDVQNRRTGDASHWIRGLEIGSSARGQSMELSKKFQELLDRNFIVFDLGSGKFKSPPPDLIQCKVYGIRPGKCVVEVAVRPFDGVVFYECHGPESYKLDDKDELVRLPLDQWISEMTT